jgi:hypothetical protein
MSANTKSRTIRRAVTLVLLLGAIGAVYLIATHPRILAFANGQQSGAGEKKVLYWYDAMDPQHHYDKAGKAPDGMDLVPAYADQAASTPGEAHDAMNMPGPSNQGRKVLYWFDPMHPAYKSDKAGIAPDCGMTLVPKYADEDMANMPAGTVIIPEDKQTLAGVRTTVVERKALIRDIRTTAQIIADESRISHVHDKVGGYIDRVFVD